MILVAMTTVKKKKNKQKTHTTHTFEAAGLVNLHNSSLKERLINTAYAAWVNLLQRHQLAD